jgi:hypothetical protein
MGSMIHVVIQRLRVAAGGLSGTWWAVEDLNL